MIVGVTNLFCDRRVRAGYGNKWKEAETCLFFVIFGRGVTINVAEHRI